MIKALRFLIILLCLSIVSLSCRIKSIEPEDYKPGTEGYLSPKEVKEIAEFKFSKVGVKLMPNVTLNLRGIKIITDGYDSNLNVGYVYLIEPPEGTKFTQEYQKPLTKSEMELLENLRKTEGYYILFINEGPREKVEESIDEFIKLLYSRNVLLKQKEPEIKKEEPSETTPAEKNEQKEKNESGEKTEESEKSE